MNLIPRAKYLVVKLRERATQTTGGIHLPETARSTIPIVSVLAVGHAVEGIKVGQEIVLSHPGIEVQCGGDTFYIVKSDSILATIEGNKC